jgi:purine nucleoside phosphorylase
MLAIIGGSGLTRLATLAVARREIVRTPYGEPSAPLVFGQIAGRDVVFLARHGHGHTIPPHRVNYRANMSALRERGAHAVVAVASVGGIRGHRPGELVLPHQQIDYTYERPRCGRRAWQPRTRGGSRSPTAASTAPCRDRAWRARRKSTAWTATARRWSA